MDHCDCFGYADNVWSPMQIKPHAWVYCPWCGMELQGLCYGCGCPRDIKKKENLCNTCQKEFANCESNSIKFLFDFDNALIGCEADKVVFCDSYIKLLEDSNES